MHDLAIRVVTPDGVAVEGHAPALVLQTMDGEITVLPGHVALMTVLAPGELRCITEQGEVALAVAGGFARITAHAVEVFAHTAERVEDDLAVIEKARADAVAAARGALRDDEETVARTSAALEREIARWHVAVKRRHHARRTSP